MEYKNVFELKTLAKERGLCGYSRLTRCELISARIDGGVGGVQPP